MISAEVSLPTLQIQAIKNKQQIHFFAFWELVVQLWYNLKYKVCV